jgi:hypothetical protein
MSTSAITVNLVNQQNAGYFQQRSADISQLNQDLQAGNLSAAQQDYTTLQSLGQTGPFNGNTYGVSEREQDFNAIGQALQSGNLSAAQQALSQLRSTFKPGWSSDGANPGGTDQTVNGTPSSPVTAGGGSEIVLNLGGVTSGEQINVNINNGSNGEQVTVGVASQQGQTPEQITFNLGSSNEQIVLNLLNNTASSSSSSTSSSQGSGVSVSA